MPNTTDYTGTGDADDHDDHMMGDAYEGEAHENGHQWEEEVGVPSVIKIGRKKYAYGLHWAAMPDASDSEIVSAAKAECKRGNYDLYCTVSHGGYAVGLRQDKQTVGMRVLAGCIIDAIDSDLIAAIPVDGGGYYILGVRAHSILDHCDVIVPSEEEARGFIEDLIGQHHWTVLAPVEWDIEGSIPETLLSLVERSRSKIVLRDATNKTRNKNMLMAAGAIIACAAAYYGYGMYQDQQEQARQQQALHDRQMAATNKKKAAIQAEIKRDWPFDSRPYGVWSIFACESAIASVPSIMPGYTLAAPVTCDGETLHVQTRFQATEDAVYSNAAAYANMMSGMKPHISRSGSMLTVDYDFSDALKKAPLYPRHDKTMSIKKEWSYLDIVFDQMHRSASFKASIEDPKDSDVEAQKAKKKKTHDQIPITVFRKLKIQISDDLPSSNYANVLSPLKAFTVQSVQYDPITSRWTMTGTAFESVVKQGD